MDYICVSEIIHATRSGKPAKPIEKKKTIASRLVWELERNLSPVPDIYQILIDLFKRIQNQKKSDNNKIYLYTFLMFSVHPRIRNTRNMSLGTRFPLSIPRPFEQTERLLGKRTIKTLIGDRGYKGKRQINYTTIEIPKPFRNRKQ